MQKAFKLVMLKKKEKRKKEKKRGKLSTYLNQKEGEKTVYLHIDIYSINAIVNNYVMKNI
jgi:hypothetical protein